MALYVPTQAAAETFVDSDHSAAGHRPSTSYPHLTPDAAAVAALNADERIERILSLKWIGYGRAAEILTALEKLIRHPKVHRMPGALIYGETNNGKTAIAQRFLEMHPPVNDPRDDCAHIPALYVQAPPATDDRRLLGGILAKLDAPPARRSMRSDQLQHQVIQQLKMVSTQILLVDEIQHVNTATDKQKRSCFEELKYLSNELEIPIVPIGTEAACNALNSDPQLSNRFRRIPLLRWKPNDDFLRLLVSFGQILPLRNPSRLVESELAILIYKKSEGTIGEIAQVLKDSAIYAIETQEERITAETINNCPYVPPSRRGRIEIT